MEFPIPQISLLEKCISTVYVQTETIGNIKNKPLISSERSVVTRAEIDKKIFFITRRHCVMLEKWIKKITIGNIEYEALFQEDLSTPDIAFILPIRKKWDELNLKYNCIKIDAIKTRIIGERITALIYKAYMTNQKNIEEKLILSGSITSINKSGYIYASLNSFKVK